MPDLAVLESAVAPMLAAGFALGSWVYGYRHGYSLFSTSLLSLGAMWLWIVVAAFVQAFRVS